MSARKLILIIAPWVLLYLLAWAALFQWVITPSLAWGLVAALLELVVGLVWVLVFVLLRFPRWPG